ncbi:hypothetical protein [Streptomyces mirabilis]|uniref:hypothetical protein n=1 Tax=Streptomyces mirabilis TaxID=68239 RepID=UPI00342ACEE6
MLHGPADQGLYATDRPRYPHQFVVAPLAPDSTHIKPHHFAGVEEPNDIAVPKDPARAAARVTRGYCPVTNKPCRQCSTTRQTSPTLRTGPPRHRSTRYSS